MEAALHRLLTEDEGIRACPSRGLLYPVVIPENTKHACSTYQRISTSPLETLEGPADYLTVRMQFDHWSPYYGECKQIAEAYNCLLDGFQGQLQDGPYVFGIELDSMTDQFDQDSRVYRVSADYFIRFTRTTS